MRSARSSYHRPPEGGETMSTKAHQASKRLLSQLADCIASGQHLKSCDNDGYCNRCGHQETRLPQTSAEKREAEKLLAPPDSKSYFALTAGHRFDMDGQ